MVVQCLLTISTMSAKKIPLWVILFWLLVWQLASMYIGYSILCPSPLLTLSRLWDLVQQSTFWLAIGSTLGRISFGFISATITAVVVAVFAHLSSKFVQLISPLILFFKSVPVASFTILILIWFSSSNLAVIIAFIMVMPLVYVNTYTAIENLDSNLNEMAELFQLTTYTKIRYVIIPQIVPYFRSACILGLGMSFKAGIAAEIIGLPKNSIGEQLYFAKLYLNTPNVFAWTIAIIAICYFYEKLFTFLIEFLCKRLEKVSLPL